MCNEQKDNQSRLADWTHHLLESQELQHVNPALIFIFFSEALIYYFGVKCRVLRTLQLLAELSDRDVLIPLLRTWLYMQIGAGASELVRCVMAISLPPAFIRKTRNTDVKSVTKLIITRIVAT